MATITQLKDVLAVLMNRTAATDLNPSNLTPAGPNIDLGLYSLNAARRVLERAHDFKYAEKTLFLSIATTGGLLTDAYQTGETVTVTGTGGGGDPDLSGTYTRAGTYNGYPIYTRINGSDTMFLAYIPGSVRWELSVNNLQSPTAGYYLSSTSQSPAGSYTAFGAYVSSGTVAVANASATIKRIQTVALPVAGGDYQPIEFLTEDAYTARAKMQIGRQQYNATKTLPALGTATGNPVAYQQGQTIYLAPGGLLSFPVVARLDVTRWMPDYTAGTDTDFFTIYAPEALQWLAVLELNKFWKIYAPREEGNVDEENVQAMADKAVAALIQWDNGITAGTSTPTPKE